MHKIELRSGRWFVWKNAHGEPVVQPAQPGQSLLDFSREHSLDGVVEQDGTGVRVADFNDNVAEEWVVRRSMEGALELATVLMEKYQDR